MFEDDDYALRVHQAGWRIVCAEDTFVHHFGQGTIGELCETGEYDKLYDANRQRFEQKWDVVWVPHARRITPEYQHLRRRVREIIAGSLPPDAAVMVVSKGDDELLSPAGRHFPAVPHMYPADSAGAIAELEQMRASGGRYLLFPKPALWWLDHYAEFRQHLQQRYPLAVNSPETCVIFDLNSHA